MKISIALLFYERPLFTKQRHRAPKRRGLSVQIPHPALAVHVILHRIALVGSLAYLRYIRVSIDILRSARAMLFSQPAHMFSSAASLSLTPVTNAKVNIPVAEVSTHDSGLSINCRHIPSSAWYFSKDSIIVL